MDTKTYQENILFMLKHPGILPDEADVYLKELKDSVELEVTRDISIWWRTVQIEKYCVLTSNYLKKKQCFDEEVRQFYLQTNVSPYIEVMAMQFYDYLLNTTTDDLLHSLAAFEKYLIKIKRGEVIEYEVQWQYEPYAILDMLLQNKDLKPEPFTGNYTTFMASYLEDHFEVIPQDELL